VYIPVSEFIVEKCSRCPSNLQLTCNNVLYICLFDDAKPNGKVIWIRMKKNRVVFNGGIRICGKPNLRKLVEKAEENYKQI
jgi:hypothetical protein